MPLSVALAVLTFILPELSARGLAVVSSEGGATLGHVLDRRQGGERLERTEALISERNHQSMQQFKKFYAQGWSALEQVPWQELQAPPETEWSELRLATTDASARDLDRIAKVFRQSKDARVRGLAVETLGRSIESRAQELLIDLYRSTEDEGERRLILSYVHPRSSRDPIAEFLLEEVRDRTRSAALRKQAALVLIVTLLPEEARQRRSLASIHADSAIAPLYEVVWGEQP